MAKQRQAPPDARFEIDPAYESINFLDTPLCYDVFRDKYAYEGETFRDMCARVSHAVMERDGQQHVFDCLDAMQNQLWMPAGRILAGAGTPKRVTLLNCFVNEKLADDMGSITRGITNIMLTMQQGGGIGTDFSPLRPNGALLRRTGSTASGPGPFIDTWDAACTTIRSAGDRRGAMMGTLVCTHPFLPEFIEAKHTKGKWTNFNVSVLVTDAFMAAVQDDEEWLLYHPAEPAFSRPQELVCLDFEDDEGTKQYVYSVWQARDLWNKIIQSTYAYAEPGVIFIDRVNDMNNLRYCEDISCTNPCGEQPLPPHGCCDLGAVNLSRMVKKPFTEFATFNYELLTKTVRLGVRFLDNVIDVTNYPLEEQRDEEFAKRRIGIGVSGLADAMHMLGIRYGGAHSVRFTETVMHHIATAAYTMSTELAQEKGAFPLYQEDEFLARPFIRQLPSAIQGQIRQRGIRNGVLLTIAPTGTTSIAYGNNSSGLEPVFAHSMRRNVRQADGSFTPYDEVAYGARLYLALHPDCTLDDLPAHMNVCADVKVHEHIRIQEVCQRWVDASISKTINVPEDISFEDFQSVYLEAYEAGCKGCTTYRPSDVRGSILSTPGGSPDAGEAGQELHPVLEEPKKDVQRDEVIEARTIKIRWPGLKSSLFFTVGYVEGRPYEVFLNGKDQTSLEWTMALTILMSKSLRMGIPLEELCEEFQQIHALEGGWAPDNEGKGRYWPSLIAYLGYKIQQLGETPDRAWYRQKAGQEDGLEVGVGFQLADEPDSLQVEDTAMYLKGAQCPQCSQYTMINSGGCPTCTNCGHSKCQ